MADEMTSTTSETAAEAEETTAVENQQSAQDTKPQQEDIGKLVTKESRKAVEKLLKDAGITPDDNPEMQLKEYKKWLDGQKSDLELAQGSVSALTGERDEALLKVTAMENRFTAVSKGIPTDRADKYVKLAETYVTDTVDFSKALDQVLLDFPLPEEKQKVPGAGGNPPPTSGKPEPKNPRDRVASKTEQFFK